MDNFSSFNRLHLNALLRDRDLDRPLNDRDLALQLLDTELRLERAEETLDVIADALDGHGIALRWPDEDVGHPAVGTDWRSDVVEEVGF